MKKNLLRGIAFVLIFLIALVTINKVMNRDYDNLTVEMSKASLPVVTMMQAGEAYNALYGYTQPVQPAMMRDALSVLNENRELQFAVNLCGQTIDAMSYEVRDKSGERLIENADVTEMDIAKGVIQARVVLKDLYEEEEEYLFTVKLDLGNNRTAAYYTRLLYSTQLHFLEKMTYVKDFHQRLYNKEAAKELTKYLEPNASLADNASFHKVNIHSSFKQITWGDLKVTEVEKPRITIREISNQTMSVLLDFVVEHTGQEGARTLYLVQEYYRIRYTPDRMYLLSYERTMDQLLDVETMYANDKILLGIGEDDVDMTESTDGNTVVFQSCNRLFSYNHVTNKLVVLFSFYEDGVLDERTLNRQHGLKILGVDEAGNVDYVVYGYMNRGSHEGQTGIWLRHYESSTNTSQEYGFVPVDLPYQVMKTEAGKLMYLTKDNRFFFLAKGQVLCANLESRTLEVKRAVEPEDSLLVSKDQKILVWQLEESQSCRTLYIENLGENKSSTIQAGRDEIIRPLGFIGEDFIYGLARLEDMTKELTGTVFMPMYKVVITDYRGVLQKEYESENVYVTDCAVEDNQISLTRVEKKVNGEYAPIINDHITNNEKKQEGKNKVSAPAIDLYGRYVQIQVKDVIDTKSLQILNPKDVLFEGGRELELPENEQYRNNYFVFGPYGAEKVTSYPSRAVLAGYPIAGTVIDSQGDIVWKKEVRSARNQIMAIKAPEKTDKENSLAVCLNAILAFEGIQRDTTSLLAAGRTAHEILQQGLENYQVFDLQGCSLDAVLYYVDHERPLLAFVGDEAVLVTGFNQYNVVIFQPSTGQLYKKGINDSAAWFSRYGNQFFSYW